MNIFEESKLKAAQLVIGVAAKGILGFGAVLVIAYCALEGFFPDGFSLSDAFLLAYATFAFGLIAAIGLIYGIISTLWATKIMLTVGNKISARAGKEPVTLHAALSPSIVFIVSPLCFFTFGLLWLTNTANDMHLKGTVGFFALLGFLLTCAFGVRRPDAREVNWRMHLILLAASVFLALNVAKPAILNFTIGMLGLRSFPNQLVLVPVEERDHLEALAKLNNLNVQFCSIPGSPLWATLDARAIWHGVGATSFVRLRDKQSDGERTILVPLQRKNVTLIRGENVPFHCTKTSST